MAGDRCYDRPSYEDFDIARVTRHHKPYPGGPARLGDPELLEAVKAALRAGKCLRYVARVAGFDFVPALCRAFKAATGLKPSEYMQAHAERSR